MANLILEQIWINVNNSEAIQRGLGFYGGQLVDLGKNMKLTLKKNNKW